MQATCYFTWEPEDEAGNIPAAFDFRITGDVEKYDPGYKYNANGDGCPPSGGGAQITGASLETVHDDGADGKPRARSALNFPARHHVERTFWAWLHQPAQQHERDVLEEELRKAAEAASEPDPDAAYERWRDDMDRQGLPLEEHP
jgi:hypothetical protein